MESVVSIITTFMLAVSGMAGVTDGSSTASPGSSELGIYELSPAGEAGGFAMPASGCSVDHGGSVGIHECYPPDIYIPDGPIIRENETTDICWDTFGRTDCILLGDLSNQGPVDGVTIPFAGCESVSPESDASYVLVCGSDVDTETLRILPQVQET